MPTTQHKCPNCGGGLEFSPQSQRFACPYCLSAFTRVEWDESQSQSQAQAQAPRDNIDLEIDENIEPQIEFSSPRDNSAAFESHTNLYNCPSCGAEIISDENTAASICYYCHNPVILSGRVSGKYQPAKVLPFRYDKASAEQTFKDWASKRWFTPSDYTSAAQLQNLTGVYLPFWLADCKINASVQALAKRFKTWREGDYRVTQTSEYLVRRSGYFEFEKIPADASSKVEDALMDAIEPFRYDDLQPFHTGYLSGFLAEKYDVDSNTVLPRIKQRASQAAQQDLMSTIIGYNSVSVTSSKSHLLKNIWSYTLLPVYLLTYSYNGKQFTYAMNGQTGKLAGALPLSGKKVAIGAVIVGLLSAVLLLLIGGAVYL